MAFMKGMTMSKQNSLALSVGLLAGVSVWVTDLLSIPTWLVFLAWLTFFFCGLGIEGLKLQFASNLWGVVVGIVALTVLKEINGPLVVTVAVVAAAAYLIAQSQRLALLAQGPGSFVGFAMIAAAMQTTGLPITDWSIDGPIYVAVLAVVLGSLFGVTSELATRALTWSARGVPNEDAETPRRAQRRTQETPQEEVEAPRVS
jgi:hypothetical protein